MPAKEEKKSVKPRADLDIFNCYTEEIKQQERKQNVFTPVKPHEDKKELYDPLTRALVSCPQLKKFKLSTRMPKQGLNKEDQMTFATSLRHSLETAKMRHQDDSDEFTVKLMQVRAGSPNFHRYTLLADDQ